MQELMSSTASVGFDDTRRAPLHDDIAQCARELWIECGQPADRDLEFWLKAEKRLFSAHKQVPRGKTPSAVAFTKRLPETPVRS